MNDRRRRYGRRRPELRIEKDSDAAFERAIRAGVLSEDPEKDNFAGFYMYMHHDAGGAAWFKHRDTRAYVTLPPRVPAGRTADKPERLAFPRFRVLGTAVLAGAFLVAGWLDFDLAEPHIGTVRLNDLTAEFLAASVRGADAPEAAAQAARTWGAALENALESVAERHGVVLLPAEAVVAGASDYTDEVRAEMRWAAPATAVPGDAAHANAAHANAEHGGAAYGETGSGADGSGGYVDVRSEARP